MYFMLLIIQANKVRLDHPKFQHILPNHLHSGMFSSLDLNISLLNYITSSSIVKFSWLNILFRNVFDKTIATFLNGHK